MADNITEERRVRIKSITMDGVTHYCRQEYDVQINHTQNTEEETFAYTPEIFWGMTKEQVINHLASRATAIEQQAAPYQELIAQLESE